MIEIMGKKIQLEKNITLWELSHDYENQFEHEIILAKVNNKLKDLSEIIYKDSNYKIEFLDINDKNAFRAYQRSVIFLLVYAIKSLCGKKTRTFIKHSINKNYYCEIDQTVITPDLLNKIKNKMHEAIEKNFLIEKLSLPKEKILSLTKEFRNDDIRLHFNRNSNLSLYKLDFYYDYYYSPMLYSLSYIKTFDLHMKLNGFVLQFPSFGDAYKLKKIPPNEKISQVFLEYSQWLKILNLQTLTSLNNSICENKSRELIYLCEALHENKIVKIANEICKHNKKIILIGGPSSSGKTTFSHRLSLQLRVNGMKPILISLDDYFLDRDKLPFDENGEQDLEKLEVIDIKKLNYDLAKLLNGEKIELPRFNFVSGKREKSGRIIKLDTEDILILEGIHGLNETLTNKINREFKFKIFVSALTQLNIDDHNRFSTTDTRMLRRIVRDNKFRGFGARQTIQLWSKVINGEKNYIFPYQEEADTFFNSALVYEVAILKQFALPLLFDIKNFEPEYCEANRLIRLLNPFLTMNTEYIPPNSILREFIGQSCFY